ncbi:MAG TPA: CotH kinase family protein [Verrucomicrobiae bacterium]|nr:CotH kinase family protein [Verrucomicrobiae bacterium]
MSLRAPDAKRSGLSGVIGIEFEYSRGELDFEGTPFHDVAVRYKGNGTYMFSQMSLKRPFKVDLNKHVKGQKLAGVSRLNFANNVADNSYISDAMSYELFREAGVPSPRTTYARLSVNVPGNLEHRYLGLYTMVENVDENFAKERFGTRKGIIFKPVTPRLFDDLGDNWSAYEKIYDPKEEPSPAQQQRVIDMAKLVSIADDQEFSAKIASFLDLDEFARFMAVTVYLSTYDSILAMGQNFYLYLHPDSNKFVFIPWDLDHSFGEFPMIGTPQSRIDASIDHPWVDKNKFLERVMGVAEFKKLYHDHLAQFLKTILRPEKIQARVDAVSAAVRPAIADESADKLAQFEKALSDKPIDLNAAPNPNPFFGGPTVRIKPYASARAESISNQLAGKSRGTIVERGMMPGGPGGRGPRGPGGPGGGFGPGMVAPGVIAAGDTDHNDKLSPAEFTALGQRWFTDWDKEKTGKLNGDQLRAGLNTAFTPPGMANGSGGPGPGGPGGGPGGPPGGFGPGMFLSPGFLRVLDKDKDGFVSQSEFTEGFAAWFKGWDTDHSGSLDEAKIRAGMNKDLAMPGGPGGVGGPGGPPRNGPPPEN